ncbi:MAG TPA: lysophospholipid acyltransferase family protein [Sphingobium sp.]|nr:lysophospholipid acyltransferase family protein [Sphingobium sp.]
MHAVFCLVRSALFALLFYTGTVLWVTAAGIVGALSDRAMQPVVNGWGRFHRILCRVILGQKIRILGTLSDEAALYVFKHESMFETIDLLCLFHNPVPVAKQELIDIPGWGRIARQYGAIGLRRAEGAKALRHLKGEVNKVRASGRPICLFPEGTRVPHGQRPPILAGFAALYQLMGLPVVPIAVDSGRLSPRNSFIKRPGLITYKVGDVIPAGLPRREAEALVHAAINALNDEPLT